VTRSIIMSIKGGQRAWNRREVLAAGCTFAGSIAMLRNSGAEDGAKVESEGPYSPFKMGLQSYSLRGYTRDGRPDLKQALDVTKELGLHFWESYTAHVPSQSTHEELKSLKQQFQAAGVSLIGFGVVPLTKDMSANRRIFELARALDLPYISADPDPEALDVVDRLLEGYEVAVGIHPHGPGHRYAKIETIAKAIEHHHPRLGCCIDTGHLLRAKQDPVDAVAAFGTRVYGVHLKDVKDATTFTILGKGDLRTVDFLKALIRNKYSYCLAIEYEENPENPRDDIKACLEVAQKAIAEARKA
jgi:sugar phosphate isomerase/epimerase